MKNRKAISDVGAHIGETVTIAGFVQALRDQNKIVFLVIRDRSGVIQCIIKADNPLFTVVREISIESVVKVTGTLIASEQAPQGHEMAIADIEVLSIADPNLPIPIVEEKGADKVHQDIRFDYRWLDLRRPEKTQIFKIWTELEKGFRSYWKTEGFIQFYAPSFMSTPSESGAEVFAVDYFDTKAYLAQSPQFYKQMAIASGFERVFAVGPVFRAEPSFTTRHMTEFTGWDFEMAYIESHRDIMDTEEGMLVAGFESLQKIFPELQIEVPSRPFPRLTMNEVKSILSEMNIPSKEEHDLSPEEERTLSEYIRKKEKHDFLFVTDYHISKRPFYHMRHADNPELTKSADLLYRGLEITTLAQREHRIEILEKQAEEKKINADSLKDYFNFFRYGCPPHGGGGIGPARIIMKLLDFESIKDVTFLPRDVKRLRP
jgi:aspartyl-tRNA synthetase